MRSFPLVFTIAVVLAATLPASGEGDREGVAVVVNGEPIFNWEIGLLLPQVEKELAIQGIDSKEGNLIRAALKRAVDSRLLAQEASRRGFEPDPARVDRKLAALADNAGGRGALEAELIRSQVTYEQLRSTVVQADLVQSLVEGVIEPDIQISEDDIAAYYADHPEVFDRPDKVHARHILIRVDPDASPDVRRAARAKAESIRERALAGESFPALAREFSEGPNASKGGDLGYTARGQMVPTFDQAVWALDAGEISEVVETDLGYSVIKVEGFVVEPPVPLDEARPHIESLLRQNRLAAAIANVVAELRKTARIEEPK